MGFVCMGLNFPLQRRLWSSFPVSLISFYDLLTLPLIAQQTSFTCYNNLGFVCMWFNINLSVNSVSLFFFLFPLTMSCSSHSVINLFLFPSHTPPTKLAPTSTLTPTALNHEKGKVRSEGRSRWADRHPLPSSYTPQHTSTHFRLLRSFPLPCNVSTIYLSSPVK